MDWSQYQQNYDQFQEDPYQQDQTNHLQDFYDEDSMRYGQDYDQDEYEEFKQQRWQSILRQQEEMSRILRELEEQRQNQLEGQDIYRYLYPDTRHNILTQQQKKYLRNIYDQAQVKFYKQQFKFDKLVRQIYQFRYYVNARQVFEILEKQFARLRYSLCEITIKTYVKDYQDREKKFQAKLDRIQREIGNILKRDCYKEYAPNSNQSSYKSIAIAHNGHQYIHFTLKVPTSSSNTVLRDLQRTPIKVLPFEVKVENTKFQNKDYLNVSNNSNCNKLKSWDIGCRIRSQASQFFYPYFQPTGEKYITFSRSMQKEQQSDIRQICIYNSFESSIVLRTVIKKQQIYLLSYSQNKKDIYIFLSSPPIYQFSVIPPNTYCLPNYLNNWQRVQNFLFLKHRNFKDNDFLRLFLYSNSYMHIELDANDKGSCENIQTDIDLIQIQLNCKKEFVSKDIEIAKNMPKALEMVNENFIKTALKFIQFSDRPMLTEHTRWKLSYQIMLLIRFNVISPDDLEDFLKFIEINQNHLNLILQCLSRRSAGYTNKVAGLNRSKKNTYRKLIERINEFLLESKQKVQGKQKKEYFKYSCLIYKVSLTPSGILPNPVSHQTKCRLIREYQDRTDFFLKITLLDDAGDTMKNQRYIYNKIMRRLLDRVNLLGKTYLPLGWSGSQLRASSLWYVNEIPNDQQKLKAMTQESILRFLGDFSKIHIAAKKAARIGQAFSSSYCYDASKINQVVKKDDLSIKKFLFTDGIGMISKDLFEDICKQFEKINIRMNCCLQIRFKGAKGVLLLNETLDKNTIVLRESMVKYDCSDPGAKKYLDILSWDKYLPGYLNRQIIILLKSLDIQDLAFLQFQRKYVKNLNELDFRELDGNLLKIFNDIDQSEDSFLLTINNLKNHFDLSKDLFFQQFLESVKDTKFAQLKKKSRILIDKSARLIGVIDDYDILQEGELYCSIKKSPNKKDKKEVIEGSVIITRNPSLSPADVRKCRCISEEKIGERMKEKKYPQNYFSKFVNCIVFPKKGSIPLTAQISGSDLDGDIFFICWDEKFIIQQNQPIETIDDPNKKSPFSYKQAGYKEMLDFFVHFANNQKLGRINNIHTIIADKSQIFANDTDCKRLAKIHGRAVDYAKSGEAPEQVPKELIVREYPDFMQKWNKPYYQSTSILGKLYRECRMQISKRKKNQSKKILVFQKDFLTKINFLLVKAVQILQILKQLKRYEQDVTQLMNHSNLQTQFQLYTGSNSQNQELKNQFGRKRLADQLKQLRDSHQNRFFSKDYELYGKYKKLKSNQLKKPGLFPQQIKTKAILCYVISYFWYYQRQNESTQANIPQGMKQFFKKLRIIQQQLGYQGKYLGFIWVIIPKIIINLKFTLKK